MSQAREIVQILSWEASLWRWLGTPLEPRDPVCNSGPGCFPSQATCLYLSFFSCLLIILLPERNAQEGDWKAREWGGGGYLWLNSPWGP